MNKSLILLQSIFGIGQAGVSHCSIAVHFYHEIEALKIESSGTLFV